MEDFTAEQKQMHDALLPLVSSESHDPDDCPMCIESNSKENAVVTDTNIEAQVNEAVSAATASLQAELDSARAELAQIKADSETADLTEQVTKLTADLESTVAELAAAKAEHDAVISFLTSEAERIEREQVEADRKETRVEAVKALKLFGDKEDEMIEASADRWASLTDEAWDAQYAEYQGLAARFVTSDPVTPVTSPSVTVITASADSTVVSSAYEDAKAVTSPANRQTVARATI